MKPLILWSDALIFLLVFSLSLFFLQLRRNKLTRERWGQVFSTRLGMVTITLIVAYIGVALLDSLHFRRALEPVPGAPAGEVFYDNRATSVLDLMLGGMGDRYERTYSAPFALTSFEKQNMKDADGVVYRDFPRLQHAGQHLEHAADRGTDILWKSLRALATGLLISAVLVGIQWFLLRRSRVPWHASWLTQSAIICLAVWLVSLSQHYHVLGTDRGGADVAYQSVKGIRTGVLLGTLATLIMLPIAVTLGVMAGYFKGWVDDVVQYLYTTLSSIPGILLIAASVLMFQIYIDLNPDAFSIGLEKADARFVALCFILGITSWSSLCRLIRAETLKISQLEYVQAAHAFGVSHSRILGRHVVPNVAHIILITFVLDFSSLVLAEAVLSYIGVGIDPSMSSWGNMIYNGRAELSQDPVVWWTLIGAFFFMFVLVLAANLFSDLVRDAFDPRTRTGEVGHVSETMRVRGLRVEAADTGEEILKGVSFDLEAGKIFALVGESGSGKSVTSLASMRLLPDALRITRGDVEVAGQDLFALSEFNMRDVRGQRVAMIFQNAMSALNPVQKVGEQVAETLRLHTRLAGNALRERVLQLFAEVGIPDPGARFHFYPHQLSGGQQQRVMIALALACEPDVLIADEPTTALDVTIQEQVLDLICELTRTRELAVLLITHDMGVVNHVADNVAVMYEGEIIEQAPAADFFRNPQQDYSRRLLAALPDLTRFNSASGGEGLLQLEGVKVHFPIRKGVLQRVVDHTRAVDGVTMEIARGETYALVGESGSGKSTLGRAILNLEPLTAGRVIFDGKEIQARGKRDMLPFRRKIQVVFQNPHSSMNPRLTVREIIREGMDSLRQDLSPAERVSRIDALLERVQLDVSFSERFPHELSGGQLQRVAIARALAVEPELIICDEPTSALDVSIRSEVLDLLKELQRASGVSYLFITHDLSIVPSLAHRVGVMREGVLVEQGSAEQILTQPRHDYTKALLESVPRLEQS